MRIVLQVFCTGVLIAIGVTTIIFAIYCIKENFKK